MRTACLWRVVELEVVTGDYFSNNGHMIPRIIARSSGRARPTPRLASAMTAMIALIASLLVAVPAAAAAGVAPTAVDQSVSSAAQVDTGIVKTAAVVGFNPENIISDALFYDSAAMTSGEIQAFLDAKIGTCRNGKCLNVLSAGISSRGEVKSQTTGNVICSAIQGGTMRVSELIYRVQVSCGISAKVILAILQKEQGLTTSTAPSDWNLSAAMGASCPDTAPCDPAFAGVGPQILKGTQQLKTYQAARFGKQPGRNYIGYSPTASCGGTYLNIQNYATAALYNYTPYQPNAAALAAGSGLGDACSAYGNRNFYRFYSDWFGSMQGETLQVLQVGGTADRYLVSGSSRWKLATAEIAAQYAWIASPRQVTQRDLDAYTDRGFAPRAVRTTSGIVYLLDSGQRLRVYDVAQVVDLGWEYGALPVADDAQAARYPDGGWLQRVLRSDGLNWLIQSDQRRQVLDLGLLPRFGIAAASSSVSAAMVAEYRVTTPVTAAGVYRDATQPYRLQTDAGVYGVPDAASGTTIARSARELTVDSFAQLPSSTTMPVRMTAAGRSYVMLEDGWLEVSAADYPKSLAFTSLPNGANAGLSTVGRVTGPHFVRERSDSQIYLVSWGTIQAVSAAERAWVTQIYGVSARVWIALDGTIGDATAPEGLVRTSAGVAYLLDGSRAYRLRDCTQVADWGGNCASLPTVTSAKLATYASAGTLQYLVRTPSGAVWLPQSAQRRQILDPSILAVYGIPATTSSLSEATVAALPVGPPALAAGVYSDGAAARALVTEGGEYTLSADQTIGVLASSVRRLTAASYAQLGIDGALPSRMRSDGRAFVLTSEGWLEVAAATYGGDAAFTALPSRAWKGIAVAANEQRPHYVRDGGTGAEYLVSGGAAQAVSGAAERASITARYGVPSKVWTIVSGGLSGVRISYDLLVKDNAGAVYLIDGNTRYRTSGCGVATDFGKDCAALRVLTPAQLALTGDGGTLAALVRSPDGFVWLPQSGAKREVPDPRILSTYGIGTASTAVSAQTMAQLRLGAPVVGVGVYDDRAGDVRLVTGDGQIFAVPASARIGTVTSGAMAISSASIDLLTAARDLPTRIDTGTQTYVLTAEGWRAVRASEYTPLAFTKVGARGAEGIGAAGATAGPHFVREQSASDVYLASGGLNVAGNDAARAWITATYGVPAKVWVVPAGTLR